MKDLLKYMLLCAVFFNIMFWIGFSNSHYRYKQEITTLKNTIPVCDTHHSPCAYQYFWEEMKKQEKKAILQEQ